MSELQGKRLSDEAGTCGGQFEPVNLQPGVGAESQQLVFCEDLSAGSSLRLSPVGPTVQAAPKLRVAAEIIVILFAF